MQQQVPVAQDAAGFLALLDLREGKRKEREIDPHPIFAAYLASIDRLVLAVDQLSPRAANEPPPGRKLVTINGLEKKL